MHPHLLLPAPTRMLVRTWHLLAIVALLLALLPFSTSNVPPIVHPVLLSLAAQQPDRVVSVIVQRSTPDAAVEALIAHLGGRVTRDLHIIDALSAEMPAAAAVALARSPLVRWVSPDSPVASSGGPDGTVNTSKLATVYNRAIRADKLWAQGYQGSSVTVAVVDSGWTNHEDFRATPGGGAMRLLTRVGFNSNVGNLDDHYGHATHVSGIIGGNGRKSQGTYIGVAPKVNFISVKVGDDVGMANASDVVAGLQWINDNRTTYRIRVVNLSMNDTVPQSYHVDPLSAACEILWMNGIVVVVSAGNSSNNGLYPPASDPFVITVGAVDDRNTSGLSDDVVASFSAYGTTLDGFAKPDLVAPGKNIIAPMSSGGAELPKNHPDFKVNDNAYFRMSGTSLAAPMVAGAVALLLQDEPGLTPDQVKYRLKATANRTWPGYNSTGAGSGYLDAYAAVTGTTTQSANTGLPLSRLLWSSGGPQVWGSVNWGSVNWGSVNWGSVNWGSVNWGSDYWGN